MPKGGKKRRAIRKKKDKVLHAQTSGTAGKDESYTCQQLEEDSCSPKTPVLTSEGDGKDGGSPSSQADGFAFSQVIEHTNGSLGNLEMHNFSEYQREGIGNLDVLVRASDSHRTLQPPQKQDEHSKDALLDWSAADAVKISNQSKDGFGVKSGNTLEGRHFADGSIQNLGFYGLHGLQTDEVSDSEGSERLPTKYESTTNFNEGFSTSSSEVSVTFLESFGKLESAMQYGDEDCQFYKEENAHRKDALEISDPAAVEGGNPCKVESGDKKMEKSTNPTEGTHYNNGSTKNWESSKICFSQGESLTSSDMGIPHKFLVPQADDLKCSERLEMSSEKDKSTWDFKKVLTVSSSQVGMNYVSPGKLELAAQDGNEVLQVPYEQNECGRDAVLSNLRPDAVETSNRLEDEIIDSSKHNFHGVFKGVEHENSFQEKVGTCEIPTFANNLLPSERLRNADNCECNSVTPCHVIPSQTPERAPNERMLDCEFPRGFCMPIKGICMSSSQTLIDPDSPLKFESATAGEHEDFQPLPDHDGLRKYTILDISESKHVERLQNAIYFEPSIVIPSERLESKPKEKLSISEISRGACVTSKGVCTNSFQASLSLKNVENLGSAMPGWHEGPPLLEEQYGHRKDVILDSSGPSVVEANNQSKDETMENVESGGTLTDMPKENPTFEGLVVSLPATVPTVDVATPVILPDLGSKESSLVVTQDAQAILKEKEQGGNPRAISEEHTPRTDLAKLNGEGEAIHLKTTLPEETKTGHKENDMVLQRREKLQTSWLGFCGMLEFFFGSQN